MAGIDGIAGQEAGGEVDTPLARFQPVGLSRIVGDYAPS